MRLKILMIDDEPDLCSIFEEFFSSNTIQIITFTQSKDAIEVCKTQSFDGAFIDYRMPIMNGDETAQNLPNTFPKFLLTGESDPKTVFTFQEILTKPFDFNRIQEIINELADAKGLTKPDSTNSSQQ